MPVDGLWVKQSFSRGLWDCVDCTVTPWKRYGLVYIATPEQYNWFAWPQHKGTCMTFDEAREMVERYAGVDRDHQGKQFVEQLRMFDFAGYTLFYTSDSN